MSDDESGAVQQEPSTKRSRAAAAAASAQEDKAAEDAAAKYKHTDAKLERDAIRARFEPLRATIVHAANGDRSAMASALTQIVDLHQGPLDEDTAADHLREAGAAVVGDRIADADAALAAARGLLPAGPAADKVVAGQDALLIGDKETAIKLIDEALPEAEASGPAG